MKQFSDFPFKACFKQMCFYLKPQEYKDNNLFVNSVFNFIIRHCQAMFSSNLCKTSNDQFKLNTKFCSSIINACQFTICLVLLQIIYMIVYSFCVKSIFVSGVNNVEYQCTQNLSSVCYSGKSFYSTMLFCPLICLYFSLQTLNKLRFSIFSAFFSVAIADYGWSIQLISVDFSFCLSCQEDSVTIKGPE